MLVVKETGDWLSVIPIAIPIENALAQLINVWASLSEQLALNKTAKATGSAISPERQALVYELVTRAARTGPIAGGKDAAEAWALRRQGDMLYLVSRPVPLSWCLKTTTATCPREDYRDSTSVARPFSALS